MGHTTSTLWCVFLCRITESAHNYRSEYWRTVFTQQRGLPRLQMGCWNRRHGCKKCIYYTLQQKKESWEIQVRLWLQVCRSTLSCGVTGYSHNESGIFLWYFIESHFLEFRNRPRWHKAPITTWANTAAMYLIADIVGIIFGQQRRQENMTLVVCKFPHI